jgi:hypothetical protein
MQQADIAACHAAATRPVLGPVPRVVGRVAATGAPWSESAGPVTEGWV